MENKGIYYIKDLRTNTIIYIGQTGNFKNRKYSHFGNNHMQIIDKYMYEEGRENFIMELFNIDCIDMSEEERKAKEDELILQYDTINNGFNMLRSGLISKDKEYQKEYLKKHYKKYYQTEEYKKYKLQYQREYRARIKQQKLANETS